MRHEPIGKELFTANRKRLVKLLAPGSVAVFNSNDIMPTNADGTMSFRQNSDLYYLSGIHQESGTVLSTQLADFMDRHDVARQIAGHRTGSDPMKPR